MGSLRRGLILATVLPTPAWAEVCAQTRPGWDGASVGPVREMLFLFSTPLSIALVLASLLVLRFRHQWGALVLVVFWTLMVTMVSMADPTGVRHLAIAEGCVGSATLFIAAVAAICVGMILYTVPHTLGAEKPD